MADKAISELVAAPSVTPDSLFVLQQDNTAKKLTAQVLENWLLSLADGHGGIQSSELLKTVGLVKTYRFTLADQTYIDIDVVDGRGIESVEPTSTNGLVVTYTITYNDGTTSTFTVTNGAKGDKGDRADIWVKYASQKPTASSHSFGDVSDAWIGIATGHNMAAAPTDWQQYTWYQWKGEKGDTGEPATLVSSQVTYQVGDSGTIIPSGSWSESIPPVPQGKYLWTKEVTQFNTGNPITKYSVSRFGIDGSGSVSTVAGVSPNADGNVPLTAANVKALPITGGTMEGPINMNGQPISGLNDPTEDTQAARKGYVDAAATAANAYTDTAVRKAAPRNLLDNSDFRNPVNQRGKTSYSGQGYGIDRWGSWNGENVTTVNSGSVSCTKQLYQYVDPQKLKPDTRYTLATRLADGTAYCVSGQLGKNTENEKLHMDFQAETPAVWLSGGSWLWAALYEGEYTAETLPEYRPKGYGAELAECQRYFQKGGQACTVGTQYGSTSQGIIRLRFVNMRIAPTIKITGVSGQGWGNIAADKLTPGWNSKCGTTYAINYLVSGDSAYIGQTVGVEYEASADL